jgi:hypothetical protein
LSAGGLWLVAVDMVPSGAIPERGHLAEYNRFLLIIAVLKSNETLHVDNFLAFSIIKINIVQVY